MGLYAHYVCSARKKISLIATGRRSSLSRWVGQTDNEPHNHTQNTVYKWEQNRSEKYADVVIHIKARTRWLGALNSQCRNLAIQEILPQAHKRDPLAIGDLLLLSALGGLRPICMSGQTEAQRRTESALCVFDLVYCLCVLFSVGVSVLGGARWTLYHTSRQIANNTYAHTTQTPAAENIAAAITVSLLCRCHRRFSTQQQHSATIRYDRAKQARQQRSRSRRVRARAGSCVRVACVYTIGICDCKQHEKHDTRALCSGNCAKKGFRSRMFEYRKDKIHYLRHEVLSMP